MNSKTSRITFPLTHKQEAFWLDDETHPEFPINNVLTSLLMTVPLVHKMERATGIKFDIGDVFSFPTIKQLVESQGDNAERKASSIGPFQAKGTGTPLFCICGINIYQELANSLGDTQPVYGIYVAEEQAFLEDIMAGKRTDISVEKLALSYYEAKQPEGPYHLAGISFGGLLAIETARLLKADNKEVLSVILLDTILPSGIKRSFLNKNKRLIKKTFYALQSFFSNLVFSSKVQNVSDISHFREQAFIKCMEVYEASDDLYDGHVVLIKAKDRSSWGKGVTLLPDYGWSRFIKGDLDIYEMEGDHLGIIKSPNVSQLAEYLLSDLKNEA